MTLSLPDPGARAGIDLPDRGLSQASQSLHQDPGCSAAPLSHASAVLAFLSLVQKLYLFAAGGLTMPAICPDAERTKRVGPLNSLVPSKVEAQGAMWSSLQLIM